MAKLVSKTYGEALFELAVEEGKEEEFLQEIESLKEILQGTYFQGITRIPAHCCGEGPISGNRCHSRLFH